MTASGIHPCPTPGSLLGSGELARQRFIWPDLWTDPSIGRLEPVVQLFFIGCFSNADDDGRLMADPAYLRATIFPYQDFRLEEVREIRARAVDGCANLMLYEVEGVEYLVFHKWSEHQKPKYPKPSKLPPPPRKGAKTSEKASGNDGGTVEETFGNLAPRLPPRVGLGGEGSKAFEKGSNRSSLRAKSLPDDKRRLYDALLSAIGNHADEETGNVLAVYAHELPEGSLAKVLESVKANNPDQRAKYATKALYSELRERRERNETAA